MVLIAFGWKLLHSDLDRADPAAAAAVDDRPFAMKDSFYPLTMPLTVGPGSISIAIALGSQRPPGDLEAIALVAGGALLGLAALAVTIFICYRFAETIVAVLGTNGTRVMIRLTAFVLLCYRHSDRVERLSSTPDAGTCSELTTKRTGWT